MKLGTQTNSFVNWMMSGNNTPPKVGAGATELLWTDRHAYQVTYVSGDGKRVFIQRCRSKRIDNYGIGDVQIYDYSELYDFKQEIVFKWGGWKRVHQEYDWVSDMAYELVMKLKPQDRKMYFREDGPGLNYVEGMTKLRKRYSPIRIVFGVQEEYYDFTF